MSLPCARALNPSVLLNFEGDRSSNPPLATFKISTDVDLDEKLDELAKSTPELAEWEKH